MKNIIYKFLFLIPVMLILNSTISLNNSFAQWVKLSGPYGKSVNCLEIIGTNLFAGTSNGLFFSSDNGNNWTSANNGLPLYVTSIAALGTNIFAGTFNDSVNTLGNGIFLSTNNGTSWTAVNNGLGEYLLVNNLAVSGTNLIAGIDARFQPGYGRIFLTTNNGSSWTSKFVYPSTHMLKISGTNIFAATDFAVCLSTNNGDNWTPVGLVGQHVLSIAISGTNIFAGTFGNGIWLSTNNGTNWTAAYIGLPGQNIWIHALEVWGTNIIQGSDKGVYLSTNNGTFWLNKNQGFDADSIDCICFAIANGYIFAGTNKYIWRRSLSEFVGINQISELVPSSYTLQQNFPNPFNPSTNIRYELPKSGFVKLVVFDALGREVETLVNEKQTAGTYEATFNASQYSSGIYFYRLTTDNFIETKKMILLK